MTLKDALTGMGTVKGTKLMPKKIPTDYQRLYIAKPRRPTRPSDIIRLWLDGDEGFPCSQYRHWLSLAEEFMAEKRGRYSFREHKDLLARAFDIWLRNRGY